MCLDNLACVVDGDNLYMLLKNQCAKSLSGQLKNYIKYPLFILMVLRDVKEYLTNTASKGILDEA